MDSNQLFNHLLKEDFIKFYENLLCELSNLFLSPDALAIYTVFILAKLIFRLREES